MERLTNKQVRSAVAAPSPWCGVRQARWRSFGRRPQEWWLRRFVGKIEGDGRKALGLMVAAVEHLYTYNI
jgi:hypothetical protein